MDLAEAFAVIVMYSLFFLGPIVMIARFFIKLAGNPY